MLKKTDNAEEQFNADLNALLLKWSGKNRDGSFAAAEMDAWEYQANNSIGNNSIGIEIHIPGIYNELGECSRPTQCITLGQSVAAKEPQ